MKKTQPAAGIRVGDWGTQIILKVMEDDAIVNLASASGSMDIIARKGDGTLVTWDATFVTDGTDGRMSYTTVANDINVPGTWRLQGFITMPTGAWKTTIATLEVSDNL